MRKRNKVILVILLVIIVLAVVGGIIGRRVVSSINEELEGLLDMEIILPDLSEIPDGTYEGAYGNIAISVELDVIVSDHRIDDIVLRKHANGQGDAAERILDSVIREQSLSVDVISGATYSSLVILKSVEDALQL